MGTDLFTHAGFYHVGVVDVVGVAGQVVHEGVVGVARSIVLYIVDDEVEGGTA